MKYLLDSNVISELVAKKPNQQVIEWLDALEPTNVYLSVITIGELAKGIARLAPSKRKDALQKWLTQELMERFDGRILEIDSGVMFQWGELTAEAERKGRQLPAIDSLIAAIAIYYACIVVTRNEADFEGTHVPVVNPWMEQK